MLNSNFQNSKQKIIKGKCLKHLNFCHLNLFRASDFGFRAFKIFLIVFLSLFLPTPVNAQGISLSLYPPLTEVMLQPGKVANQTYELTNNSENVLYITSQVLPFQPDGQTGLIKIIFPSPGKSTPEPILFSFDNENIKLNELFKVEPKQTIRLVLNIGLPRKSPQKDYYYTLFFSTAVLEQNSQNQTASVSQIGSNILITSSQSGSPPYSGRIAEFSVPKLVDSFSPINFKVLLENTGDNFWKPFGKITINGWLNQKDEVLLLEQNVLSQTTRKLEIENYKPKLAFGNFKAKLEFKINETGSEFSAETSFFYFPFKLVGVILIILAVLRIIRKIRK